MSAQNRFPCYDMIPLNYHGSTNHELKDKNRFCEEYRRVLQKDVAEYIGGFAVLSLKLIHGIVYCAV